MKRCQRDTKTTKLYPIFEYRLNIAFDSADASFAPSGTLFRNQVITTGQFTGWTVQQLYDAANTAIGCGGSKTYLSSLTTAMDIINNSWSDGVQRNNYIACPRTASARTAVERRVMPPFSPIFCLAGD